MKLTRTAYFCSLKFAPGLLKEIIQLATKMAQYGWQSKLILSRHYGCLGMPELENVQYLALTTSESPVAIVRDCLRFPFGIQRQLAGLIADVPPDFLCMYNPHPLNCFVASMVQQSNPAGLRATFLHEPFVPEKSSYGFVKSQYIRVVEHQQAQMMHYLNCVVVPSVYSLELFQRHYPADMPVHVAPILLGDQQRHGVDREYYSFVGTVNASRSLDDFVQLINLATVSDTPDLKFKIVTRSPIDPFLRRIDSCALQNVEIVNRPVISDAEIGETFAKSKATFLSHKQAAQSGNVPFAFMQGTPIICRDIPGLTQHVHHQVNGYVLPYDFTIQQMYAGIRYLEDNGEVLGRQARHDYEEIFDVRNWERYYSWLV